MGVGLSRVSAASLRTTFAALGATLAVLVVVLLALAVAPIANFCANLAVLLGPLAVNGQHADANQAGFYTLHAAFGTIVVAGHGGHLI